MTPCREGAPRAADARTCPSSALGPGPASAHSSAPGRATAQFFRNRARGRPRQSTGFSLPQFVWPTVASDPVVWAATRLKAGGYAAPLGEGTELGKLAYGSGLSGVSFISDDTTIRTMEQVILGELAKGQSLFFRVPRTGDDGPSAVSVLLSPSSQLVFWYDTDLPVEVNGEMAEGLERMLERTRGIDLVQDLAAADDEA